MITQVNSQKIAGRYWITEQLPDKIYKAENKVQSKHPGQFEKYTGFFGSLKYHLILYHKTKIVHTLFPDKKNFNKKKENILPYKQAELLIEATILNELIIGKYRYLDSNNVERYVIIFRLDNSSHIQQIYIQINYTDGRPFYSEKISEIVEDRIFTPEEYFYALENTDITKLEKVISRVDKETFEKPRTQ